MTPKELKEIADNASKKNFEEIYAQLKLSAEKGYHSCEFKGLPEGVVEHLKSAGFIVEHGFMNNLPGLSTKDKQYTVKFK